LEEVKRLTNIRLQDSGFGPYSFLGKLNHLGANIQGYNFGAAVS
jgi:hypothetical protein